MNIFKPLFFVIYLTIFFTSCNQVTQEEVIEQPEYTGKELAALTTSLNQGWNLWDTRSLMTHVLLPESFAIHLQLNNNQTGDTLKVALVGNEKWDNKEKVIPGPHAYDGSYSELITAWQDITVQVKSATVNNEFYLLIKPLDISSEDTLIISPEMLWDRKGEIKIEKNVITATTPTKTIELHTRGNKVTTKENIKVSLDKDISISTDATKTVEEVIQIIADAKAKQEGNNAKYEKTPELYDAMQTVLAWDLIYEPSNNRTIAPVSRRWNVGWEGWVLFDWDTYFAAQMFSVENKELAYANAIAITKEISEDGFIPNFGSSRCKSEDRSQPPVGAYAVKEIYKHHQEKWFLHEVFDELLIWNRWWDKNRNIDGYLVWGSDPYVEERDLPKWLTDGIGTKQGAMWESGLDNSPLWDDAIYDTTINRLMLADVGLMSFYIWDCRNLAEIAEVIEKPEIAKELNERADVYTAKLNTLWNEEFGLYLNLDLVTGEPSYRLSPTLFYPLLAKAPSQEQAQRMMQEHFYNPEEFWGDYILPAISRNDPAFEDNIYWRGRIWAPMNYLVYLGIINYDLPQARKDIVEKSKQLLMQSWTEETHVYENYSSVSGRGDDAGMSDAFYHWGALLGYISIIEEGYVPSPLEKIK